VFGAGVNEPTVITVELADHFALTTVCKATTISEASTMDLAGLRAAVAAVAAHGDVKNLRPRGCSSCQPTFPR